MTDEMRECALRDDDTTEYIVGVGILYSCIIADPYSMHVE